MAKNSSFEELANCPSFARAVSNPRTNSRQTTLPSENFSKISYSRFIANTLSAPRMRIGNFAGAKTRYHWTGGLSTLCRELDVWDATPSEWTKAAKPVLLIAASILAARKLAQI